jgi:SAM-dependent methyltransferase
MNTNGSSCMICRSQDHAIYLDDHKEALESAAFGSSRGVICHGRILRCVSCGFAFRQVRSSEQELSEVYRRMDPGLYEAEASGRARTAARHLKIVQRYLPPGRVLDVGCASGLFLRLAQNAGWQVVGLEPSEALFEKASTAVEGRGEVYRLTLEEADLAPATFDAVTIWDVLEHVPDPLGFMKTCRSLLKPKGHLFLNIPNLDSKEARWLGTQWPLLLAEHLNYFNPPSLRLCGEKAGIEWLDLGQRPSSFSIGYILYRLSQHSIPGANFGRKLARGAVGKITVPIYLGELCAVGRRRDE